MMPTCFLNAFCNVGNKLFLPLLELEPSILSSRDIIITIIVFEDMSPQLFVEMEMYVQLCKNIPCTRYIGQDQPSELFYSKMDWNSENSYVEQ